MFDNEKEWLLTPLIYPVLRFYAEKNRDEDICKCTLVFEVDSEGVHFLDSPLFKIQLVGTLREIINNIKDSIE